MAVTVADVAVALRLSADGTDLAQAQTDIISRLIGVAEAHIDLLAPNAPEVVQDEATIRMATYIYDMPSSSRRDSYANSWVNSGAGPLLANWIEHRANGTAASATGSTSSGVDTAAVNALIAAALQVHAGLPNVHHTPRGGGGGLNSTQVQTLIDESLRFYVTNTHFSQELARVLGPYTTETELTAALAAYATTAALTQAISTHAGLPNVHHTPPGGASGSFPTTRTAIFTGSAASQQEPSPLTRRSRPTPCMSWWLIMRRSS